MSYKTCVTVTEKTPKKTKQTLSRALKRSDYAEIRFDFLKPKDVPYTLELIKNNLKRCVCTLRPKKEGGKFSSNEKERISILKLISEYSPFLLDIEFQTIKKNKDLQKYIKKSKTQILVSWHDFKKTPSMNDLLRTQKKMAKFSKNIKIVTSAKSLVDSTKIMSLYNPDNQINLIAFCMGEIGRHSRILCLYLGSPFTYVSLGKPVAPGQFSLDEVKSIFGKKQNR